MTQAYHSFPYPPEQAAALDATFDQWLDADCVAAYNGYDNEAANEAAAALATEYDRMVEMFRQWIALPEELAAAYDAVWHVGAEEVM